MTTIAFDGDTVSVTSDVQELHELLHGSFAHMLSSSTKDPIARFSVLRDASGFVLKGPAFNPISLSVLDQLLVLLKDEIRLEFMRHRPDLLWLHAGGVERDGSVILILGSSGQGKSTMVSLLCERGCHLLSDDIVPISMDADLAYPFPQTPSRRIPSTEDWDVVGLGTAPRETLAISIDSVASSPTEIGALVFPRFERHIQAELIPLTKGETALEMLRNSTNFCDHKAEAVTRAAKLAESVPGYRLLYRNRKEASFLFNEIGIG